MCTGQVHVLAQSLSAPCPLPLCHVINLCGRPPPELVICMQKGCAVNCAVPDRIPTSEVKHFVAPSTSRYFIDAALLADEPQSRPSRPLGRAQRQRATLLLEQDRLVRARPLVDCESRIALSAQLRDLRGGSSSPQAQAKFVQLATPRVLHTSSRDRRVQRCCLQQSEDIFALRG